MGDEDWTIVVRRRTAKLRRTSVSETSARHSRISSGFPANAPTWQADECDKASLLLKMKRSMTRLQESAFFKKFLDQVQSPAVLNRLCRAASGLGFESVVVDDDDDDKQERDGEISDEGKVISLGHKSISDMCLQITSLTKDGVFECTSMFSPMVQPWESTSLRAPRLRPCEYAQKDLESSISVSASPCASMSQRCEGTHNDSLCDTSKCLARTFRGRRCCSVECESLAKVCCSRYTGDAVCICRNDAPMATEGCAETEKGLTSIDGVEGYRDSIMKSRPGCKIGRKHWRLRVVLYGLGSIMYSEVSRYQLALILLLKKRFSWVGEIEVYDPVLSKFEYTLIEGMGCVPIVVDEKGRRSISEPTLFYMPHCEEWLYDQVLQTNWVPDSLGQLVILGNSFQDYQEQWSMAIRRKPRPPTHVIQYQQLACEIPLKVSSSDLPGFNDLSWHFYEPREEGNSTLKLSIAS